VQSRVHIPTQFTLKMAVKMVSACVCVSLIDDIQSVFQLLAVNWRRLVDVIFADDFRPKLGSHYDVLMFSFCRLWNRMIKRDSRGLGRLESASDQYHDCIVDTTTVLLDRLKSGQLPALCRGKCLAVLMQAVWLDPSRSTPVAPWKLSTAESVLSVLSSHSSNDAGSSKLFWSFDCCLIVNNHNSTAMGSPMTCTRSGSASHVCGTGRLSAVKTRGASQLSSTESPRCLALNSSDGTSATSDGNMSVVENGHLTSSQGLCFGLGPCLSSHTITPVSSEESDDCKAVSCDVKLVRKFVLLVLRCLDIVAREPADQCKLASLLSVYGIVLC